MAEVLKNFTNPSVSNFEDRPVYIDRSRLGSLPANGSVRGGREIELREASATRFSDMYTIDNRTRIKEEVLCIYACYVNIHIHNRYTI